MKTKLRIPAIAYKGEDALIYRVPSKSREELMQLVEFRATEEYLCTCEGAYWIKQQGLMGQKTCRHYREVTIGSSNTPQEAIDALKHIVTKLSERIGSETMWSFVTCLQPEKRGELNCPGCLLYPYVCNTHLIKIGTRKPLVWKLQTAIYNRRPKDAKKLIRQIIKEVKKCQNENTTSGKQTDTLLQSTMTTTQKTPEPSIT